MYDDESFDKDLLFILIGIGTFLYLILTISKYLLTQYAVHRGNENIYLKMIDSLMKSPVIYFDQNPSGRILNRFTSDMSLLDTQLNYVLVDSIDGPFYSFNLFITIIVFNYWLVIPGIVELIAMYYFYKYMKPILVELKKVDMLNKSPVQSFFTATLSGIVPMRIYNQ